MRATPRIGGLDYTGKDLRAPTPEDRYLQDGLIVGSLMGSRENTLMESAPATREQTWQMVEPAPSPRNKIPKGGRKAERNPGGDGTPTKGEFSTANGTPVLTEAGLRRILREELSVALAAERLESTATPRPRNPGEKKKATSRTLTALEEPPSVPDGRAEPAVKENTVLEPIQFTTGEQHYHTQVSNFDPTWADPAWAHDIQTSRSKIEIEALPLYDLWPDPIKKLIDWWMNLKEPERSGSIEKFVDGLVFNILCTVVILLNSIFIIADTNNEMYTSITSGAVARSEMMSVFEKLFLCFYCFELLVKLYVHRLFYFCSKDFTWNLFDFFLIFFGLIGLMLEQDNAAVDTTFLRIMRLIKIVKILRAVRLMRLLEPLRLILNCLIHSVSSLFWSLVMMVLFFFLFSTVFVQLAAGHLQTNWARTDPILLDQLEADFGSVQAAMLSLYQASTGGNDWAVFYGSLTETGGMNSVAYLFFVAFTQVALLNIITGLFIESALKHATPNAESRAMQNRVDQLDEIEMLSRIFQFMDTNNNGEITFAEFDQGMKASRIRHTLEVLGLDTFDTRNLFTMMQEVGHESSETLTLEIFIHSCLRLRGGSTSRDIQVLLTRVKDLDGHLEHILRRFEDMEKALSDEIEVDLDKGQLVV